MSIKPIDFQVMIPRTMEVAKISNDETQKNQALLQQQTSAMQHKVDNNLKQVYSRAKPQEAKITERQKDNEKNKKKNGKVKADAGSTENKSLNNPIQTSTIDIKI